MNDTEIDLQINTSQADIPSFAQLTKWVNIALEKTVAQLSICVVDEQEIAELNRVYRKKNRPTNVLSFPLTPTLVSPHILQGDIALCAPIISKEAQEQNKPVQDHFAHLVVHSVLHLKGYDHEEEADAGIMEAKEIKILSKLGIKNPYE